MKIRIIDLMDSYYDNSIKPDLTHTPIGVHATITKEAPAYRKIQKTLIIAAALILIVIAGYFSISLSAIWSPSPTSTEQKASNRRPEENTLGTDSSSLPQQGILYEKSSLEASDTNAEDIFFSLFPELDRDSVYAYLEVHPEALADGWQNLNINESSLEADGTEIQTIHGDQVLAVNANAGIVLIRLSLSSGRTRGVMAICKDTSRLSLCPAETIGSTGQTVGTICEANNGILAITGNGFLDPDGTGNGGTPSGLAICSGQIYGSRLGATAKRLELRSDGRMYIVDSTSPINNDTTDACEFQPAIIVDGEYIENDWTSIQPRVVLGQTARLETMMVVVEGRLLDSFGCGLDEVGEVMLQYGCVQALNLDGGTSAIMYYDGEYITRCSNTALPEGRTLPTAWVYRAS